MGSFNPIHLGHVAIGKYVVEHGLADEVWCIVSPQNPLKEVAQVSFEDRLAMTKIAFSDEPKISVCDIENELPRPSYTINTIEELKKRHIDVDFFILCGSDIANQLDRWHRIEDLRKEVEFLIYPRGGGEFSEQFNGATLFDVSSTDIRSGFKRDFLPKGVYEYALENGLYIENWRAETFYDLGVMCYSKGDFGGALNALNKALEVEPNMKSATEMVVLVKDILAFRHTDLYNP